MDLRISETMGWRRLSELMDWIELRESVNMLWDWWSMEAAMVRASEIAVNSAVNMELCGGSFLQMDRSGAVAAVPTDSLLLDPSVYRWMPWLWDSWR